MDYGSLSSSQDGIKVGTLGNSYGGSETSNINFYIFPKQDDAGNYCQVPDFKITILVKDQSEIIGYVIIEVVDSEKSDKVKDINIIHFAAANNNPFNVIRLYKKLAPNVKINLQYCSIKL